ncbi:hypothetical protein K0B04_01095 [Patescibacteria group bacterium]|nr:hypothetical protein [Patescibacteria group bacterium]
MLEAVLPLPILSEVINSQKVSPVIRAVMDRELKEDGTATFSFSHYEKVKKVEVQTVRL